MIRLLRRKWTYERLGTAVKGRLPAFNVAVTGFNVSVVLDDTLAAVARLAADGRSVELMFAVTCPPAAAARIAREFCAVLPTDINEQQGLVAERVPVKGDLQ